MSSDGYHVVPNGKEWLVEREGAPAVKGFSDKQDAVAEARRLAQRDEVSLYIHSLDGRIQDERSFGNDPYPPKG